jgi:hypothetical protein
MRKALLCLFAIPAVSAAQPSATPETMPPQPASGESPRFASLTISPIHAIALPMAELMIEFRPTAKIGLAAIGGIGRVESNGISATATEAGAQASYYVFRDFRGMHVGGEVLYLHLGDIEQDMTLSGEGLSVGGFVGWKYIGASGFTFVAQGGVSYVAARAENATSTAEKKRVYPLVNLNLGWSL